MKSQLPKIQHFNSPVFAFVISILFYPMLFLNLYHAIKCVVQYEKIKYLYQLNPEQYDEQYFSFATSFYNDANSFLNLIKLVLYMIAIFMLFVFFMVVITL